MADLKLNVGALVAHIHRAADESVAAIEAAGAMLRDIPLELATFLASAVVFQAYPFKVRSAAEALKGYSSDSTGYVPRIGFEGKLNLFWENPTNLQVGSRGGTEVPLNPWHSSAQHPPVLIEPDQDYVCYLIVIPKSKDSR